MASKTSLHSLCLPFSLFFSPSRGALRTQKCMQVPSQRTPKFSLQRTPKFSLLKPGADQNIAFHSWPADRDSAFVKVAFLIHSTSFSPDPLQRLTKWRADIITTNQPLLGGVMNRVFPTLSFWFISHLINLRFVLFMYNRFKVDCVKYQKLIVCPLLFFFFFFSFSVLFLAWMNHSYGAVLNVKNDPVTRPFTWSATTHRPLNSALHAEKCIQRTVVCPFYEKG